MRSCQRKEANKVIEAEIRNSGMPLIMEARTGIHILRVNKARFEDCLSKQIIDGCECLTVFNYYDSQGNLIGSQVWNREKDISCDDDYYIAGELKP